MRKPTLDGWLSWDFNNVPYSVRTHENDRYNFHVNIKNLHKPKLYYEEIYNNARAMRDYFTEGFDVLLSGGIDSEIIVRTFKDLKIKHNTFIFRYNNNYNYRDVNSAIDICECLNIPYKIVDIDLKKFFEQDAYDLFKKSGCIRAARLPHLKFFDYLDNIPVMGDGEVYWLRKQKMDYSIKSEWLFPINESNHNCSMYLHSLGRENLCDWYEFTPNFIKSFNQLPIIQNLINDNIPGKQSSWSLRLEIYRVLWPDIKDKVKLTGYEGEELPGVYPEFIHELQKTMETEIGCGTEYWFTFDELNKVL